MTSRQPDTQRMSFNFRDMSEVDSTKFHAQWSEREGNTWLPSWLLRLRKCKGSCLIMSGSRSNRTLPFAFTQTIHMHRILTLFRPGGGVDSARTDFYNFFNNEAKATKFSDFS